MTGGQPSAQSAPQRAMPKLGLTPDFAKPRECWTDVHDFNWSEHKPRAFTGPDAFATRASAPLSTKSRAIEVDSLNVAGNPNHRRLIAVHPNAPEDIRTGLAKLYWRRLEGGRDAQADSCRDAAGRGSL